MNRKNFYISVLRFSLIFAVGGIGYYLIEVLFRGHSHWTMGVCGGVCLVGIYIINRRLIALSYTLKAMICALLITTVEFAAGCILNIWLGLGIWDYSALPFNLLGQISLLFSAIWFALSFALCFVLTKLFKAKRMPTQGILKH